MNYNNVLLLGNNYITLKENEICYQLYLDEAIYNNGLIINADVFVKFYIKFIKEKKLSKHFWKKNIQIIYNSLYRKEDKINLYNIFKDLNYRDIQLISEKKYLHLNKSTCYLLVGKYLRLFYIDKNNSKRVLILDQSLFHKNEIKLLISNRVQKKNLYIIGDLSKIYELDNLNYYYFTNYDEFFLKNNL